MCVYQVINVKLQATTKLFIEAIFYQINPIQNTRVNTEITENTVQLGALHKFKIGEKFILIVFIAIQHNLTLLTFFSYCCKILIGTRVQSEQLIAHNSFIVKRIDAVSVTNTRYPFILHTIASGVNCIIRSTSQGKQKFYHSKQVSLTIKAKFTDYSLKSVKIINQITQ